jgi:hypothetical protein
MKMNREIQETFWYKVESIVSFVMVPPIVYGIIIFLRVLLAN